MLNLSDTRRSALASGAALALFGCGLGATLAAQHRDEATCALLAIVAVWIGAAWAWNVRPVPEPDPAPSAGALEAAHAERQVLANLLDQAPAPMLTLHADGAVRAANRAARRLFSADDRLTAPPKALLEAFAAGSGEARRLTVDLGAAARRKTYAMSATDFVGPRGVRRVAVLLDIEPDLQAAEAAALRELMGVLNHELMNGLTPIASLAGSAADLLAEPGAEAEARRAILTIARRSEGLGRFVAAYRALAQLPPPARRPVALGALLDDAATLFRARWSTAGVTLHVVKPDPEVICQVDEELLVRALGNLLANAAEAAVAAAPEPRVDLTGQIEDGSVILTVSDNGAGVAEADRQRIFQVFYTTRATGTGVGLSLARQIARSHGGELNLPAASNSGATFELRVS